MTDWYSYPYKELTGGGDGALDSLDGSLLKDGDMAYIVVASTGNFYVYYLDEDSGLAESSPDVIAPDANAGNKRWILATSSLAIAIGNIDFTQTGTGAIVRTLQNKLQGYVDIQDFCTGDGSTDDTAKFQAAVDAHAPIFISKPSSNYKITATIDIDTNNRCHIFGVGISSAIYFSPSANGDTLFNVNGNFDNLLFENFYCYFANAASKVSATCFDIASTVNTVVMRNVTIDSFDEYGFKHDSAMYDKFEGCRFINMDNHTANDHVAKACYFPTFANVIHFDKCRFSQNDMCIHAVNVHGFSITRSSFESNGDSGEAHITSQIHIETGDGFCFETSNYVEANRTTTGYAFLRCDGVGTPVIKGNTFNGDLASTTYTHRFLSFDANCKNPLVENNEFSEVLEYFFSTSVYLRAYGNKYVDGAAAKTAYNDIMALIDGNSVVELDTDFTFAWNPADLSDNTGEATGQTITGLRFGDKLTLCCNNALSGLLPYAYPSAANTAYARLFNLGTGGNINIGNETFRIQVTKGR